MKKRRNKVFLSNGFFIVVIVISILIIIVDLALYNYYLEIEGSISGSAGNTGTLSLFVEGDNVSPAISITDPENTSYTSHRTELKYTVSDDNLNSCWYSLDLGATNTTITCGNNVSGISSVEGSNTWKVYVNDTLGNKNLSSVTFVVSIPSAPAAGAAGGGGGGGAIEKRDLRDFDIAPKEFNLFVIPGEKIEREIKVTNTGKVSLTLDIKISGIGNITTLDSERLVLAAGKEANVMFKIKAPETGISAGRIVFSSDELIKEVFILINVRSEEKKLFDSSITVPESYKVISPRGDLSTFVSLLEVGPPVEVDVTVNYIIKDFDGNTVYTESETLSVYKVKSFVKKFFGLDLPPGDYVVGMEVNYPGGFATSSSHFSVSKREINYNIIIAFVLAILAVIVIVYSIIMYKKAGRHLRRRR